MGCGSCGKNNGSHSPGCGNNGACSSGSCNKLNAYNWLTDMVLPEDYTPFNVVEVRFKGSKKMFFKNEKQLELYTGDKVIVDSDIGYDLGEVSLSGELVKLQLKKYGVEADNDQMRKILNIASEEQIEKYQKFKDSEKECLTRARTIALQMNLKMKISDIEFQGDGKRVTFYYTSEGRVDFRELIRRYASEFKARIQMLQVSYREEASRLGGIGSCGRELCCSTWLTDYKVVSMAAPKTQNLSINMLKLSGQCGRLKCCLNYELEMYSEALSHFPNDNVRLKTESGLASLKKIDILKQIAWYSYEKSYDWIALDLERVQEIISQNKKGIIPPTLSDTAKGAEIAFKTLEYKDDLLDNKDVSRLDKQDRKNRGKGRGRGNNSNRNKKGGQNRNRGRRDDRPQGEQRSNDRGGEKREGGNRNNRNRNNRNRNNRPNKGPNNKRPRNDGPKDKGPKKD